MSSAPLSAPDRELIVQIGEQRTAVRQIGERVGERHLVHLFEQQRVPDDASHLVADAIEQAAVLLAERAGLGVIDRQRPHELIAVDERIGQRET